MKKATAIILAASLAMPMAAVTATPAASWVKINNWIDKSNEKIKNAFSTTVTKNKDCWKPKNWGQTDASQC